MNEAAFKRSVIHKLKGTPIYIEAMANSYRGGTPDHYYEAERVLWVEYKWNDSLRPTLMMKPTALQTKWLTRADNNRVQVALVMGTKEYVYIRVEPPFDSQTLGIKLPRRNAYIEWIKEIVL